MWPYKRQDGLQTNDDSVTLVGRSGSPPQPRDRDRHGLPVVRGDRPVSEALAEVGRALLAQGRLTSSDQQSLIAYLAQLPWAGPLTPWMEDEQVVDLEIGGDGVLVARRADGEVRVTGQVVSPEWIRFLVRLWRLNRGSEQTHDPLTASTTALWRYTYVGPQFSVSGPTLSVRLRQVQWTLAALEKAGMFPARLTPFLTALSRSQATVVISGGSGAGKTALQEALLRAVDPLERILTITMECEFLLPDHPRSLVWELSPDRPDVEMLHLVQQAMKSQPDRINIGEVRGAETGAWIYAINSGVKGGMVTVHANSPAEALDKLLSLARLDSALAGRELAKWIVAARPVVVQIVVQEGKRQVSAIGECSGFTERGGEVHFTVAHLWDGKRLDLFAASDHLLAALRRGGLSPGDRRAKR